MASRAAPSTARIFRARRIRRSGRRGVVALDAVGAPSMRLQTEVGAEAAVGCSSTLAEDRTTGLVRTRAIVTAPAVIRRRGRRVRGRVGAGMEDTRVRRGGPPR